MPARKLTKLQKREVKRSVRAAFSVARRAKKLFIVEVAVEVRSRKELEQVTEDISNVLLPLASGRSASRAPPTPLDGDDPPSRLQGAQGLGTAPERVDRSEETKVMTRPSSKLSFSLPNLNLCERRSLAEAICALLVSAAGPGCEWLDSKLGRLRSRGPLSSSPATRYDPLELQPGDSPRPIGGP